MNLNALSILVSSKVIPLIYAFIGFGLLIMVHEFGHFFFCKMFGIHTPTFSIGFGPKIIQKKIGSTNFRIAAIPLGGYVEIAGLAEVGQGKQKLAKIHDENSFTQKPYWQKLLVLSGGVLFNIFFAYIVYSMLFFIGIPKKKVEFYIASKIEDVVKEKFKIEPGDKIVSISNKKLSSSPKKLLTEIHKLLIIPLTQNKSEQLQLGIMRGEKLIDITIPIELKELNNKLIGSFELKTTPIEGKYEKYPIFSAISQGIKTTNNILYQTLYAIKYLITTRSLAGAGGPVMIITKTFETAQKGIIPLFLFLAFISINLAIINLLPIGALDGGQILFATIEAIIRREIPNIIRLIINITSWVLILWLILYLTYKDILRLLKFR
ncbi:site-2 protease family protein [Candidatus Babeliales bacterium]|nr:site-2 protease family protein [Candidatus Babeliales bacterium]